jgi:uncharacterized protein involved in tolerance to divalent cations
MEVIIVYSTFPNKETARQIGTQLIEKQLAACVNLLPQIESIYQWNGEMNHDEEFLMVMKTTKGRYEELEKTLTQLHPYECPELICTNVECGYDPYIMWVRERVSPDS